MKDAPYVAIASLASTSEVRNGWNWVTGLGSFGYNYPLRAMVAGPCLGGQGEHEAMYPLRVTDSKNQPLTGANQTKSSCFSNAGECLLVDDHV